MDGPSGTVGRRAEVCLPTKFRPDAVHPFHSATQEVELERPTKLLEVFRSLLSGKNQQRPIQLERSHR